MSLKERAREVADELLWVVLKMDSGATNGEHIRLMQPLILASLESVRAATRAETMELACKAVCGGCNGEWRVFETAAIQRPPQDDLPGWWHVAKESRYGHAMCEGSAIRRALGEDRAE